VAALDLYHARIDEFAEVMRERRLRNVEQGNELALAERLAMAAQHVDDVDAQLLRQRLGEYGNALGIKRAVEAG
jgi:hypothetical protein